MGMKNRNDNAVKIYIIVFLMFIIITPFIRANKIPFYYINKINKIEIHNESDVEYVTDSETIENFKSKVRNKFIFPIPFCDWWKYNDKYYVIVLKNGNNTMNFIYSPSSKVLSPLGIAMSDDVYNAVDMLLKR